MSSEAVVNQGVIEVERISKEYRLGARGANYSTLRDALALGVSGLFRSGPRRRPSSERIKALDGVSFQVGRGEAVGIIGRNGAGKSTLLKLLSRITEPSAGRARIRGRVGCLLEVGTGFHPELTGRENIYLNGAILGMRRTEITRKFDEIVAFAEIERFLDTPVKFYSSGMYVRLAFAVAAHLETEILLVDEVLAVGDFAFQKKCLGKMEDVTQSGRTILFVSHNMAAIRNLCARTVLLERGRVAFDGPSEEAVSRYLDQNLVEAPVVGEREISRALEGVVRRADPTVRLKEIAVLDGEERPRAVFHSDEEIRFALIYECVVPVADLRVSVRIVDGENRPILVSQNLDDEAECLRARKEPGVYRSVCRVPGNMFGEKDFYVTAWLVNPKTEHLIANKILRFSVRFKGYHNIQYGSFKDAYLRPQLKWETAPAAEPAPAGEGA